MFYIVHVFFLIVQIGSFCFSGEQVAIAYVGLLN